MGVSAVFAALIFGAAHGASATPDLIGELVSAYSRENSPAVAPLITALELEAGVRAGRAPVFIDARAEREIAYSSIPGAVPLAKVQAEPALLEQKCPVPEGCDIVVYCTVGYRSGLAARALRKAGFASALNLQGGILAWSLAGGPIVSNEIPARSPVRVNVWSLRRFAAFLRPGYEAVE